MAQASITDLYPSRVTDMPSITERQDPALWCDLNAPPPGPLTREQLAAFERDGFLFLPDVFTPDEVERFRMELSRMANDSELRGKEETVLEEDGEMVRSIFRIHRLSDVFRKLAKDPRVADAARQVLGSDVYIHQSRINLKKPLYGKGFFWHSDFETWHVEDGMPRPRAVSASVALTENNEFNGPVMVIPGSHKRFVACVGETPDDYYKQSLRKQEAGTPDLESMQTLVAESSIQAPKGAPGGVLFFECNMMHGSTENLSPFPRSNAFFVFNSVENTLAEPFSGKEPRPEFAGERDFTPVGDL